MNLLWFGDESRGVRDEKVGLKKGDPSLWWETFTEGGEHGQIDDSRRKKGFSIHLRRCGQLQTEKGRKCIGEHFLEGGRNRGVPLQLGVSGARGHAGTAAVRGAGSKD